MSAAAARGMDQTIDGFALFARLFRQFQGAGDIAKGTGGVGAAARYDIRFPALGLQHPGQSGQGFFPVRAAGHHVNLGTQQMIQLYIAGGAVGRIVPIDRTDQDQVAGQAKAGAGSRRLAHVI